MYPKNSLTREVWKKLINEFMPDVDFSLFLQDVVRTKLETGFIFEESMERLLRRGLRYLLFAPNVKGIIFGFEESEYYDQMGENKTRFKANQILPTLPECNTHPQSDSLLNDTLRTRLVDDGTDSSIFRRPYLAVYNPENNALGLENIVLFGVKLED